MRHEGVIDGRSAEALDHKRLTWSQLVVVLTGDATGLSPIRAVEIKD